MNDPSAKSDLSQDFIEVSREILQDFLPVFSPGTSLQQHMLMLDIFTHYIIYQFQYGIISL